MKMKGGTALRWLLVILISMFLMVSFLFIQLLFRARNTTEEYKMDEVPRYHLQIIIQNADGNFGTSFCQGAKDAGRSLGVYVEFVTIKKNDIEELREAVEKGINAKVDGIALQPLDLAKSTAIINEARKQNIDIITYENNNFIIPEVSMIGSNSYNVGYTSGIMAADAIEKEGNAIVFLNDKEEQGDIQYKNMIVQGIVEAFSAYPAIKLNNVFMIGNGMFEAEKSINSVLQKYENIDVIICVDERSTPGVAQALVDNNKVGDIKLIGYGVTYQTLKYINRGVVFGTVCPNAYDIGYLTVEQLTKSLEGEQISDSINTDLYTIDATTVTQYLEDDAK